MRVSHIKCFCDTHDGRTSFLLSGKATDSADTTPRLIEGISERHAKELAKRINALLAMSEEALCPPTCQRCDCSGKDRGIRPYQFHHKDCKTPTDWLLCWECVEKVESFLGRSLQAKVMAASAVSVTEKTARRKTPAAGACNGQG